MTNEEMIRALRRKGMIVTPPAPQRKTHVLSEGASYPYSEERGEPILSEGNKPQDWKNLANPRVPWPKNLDPGTVLHELSPFLTYRLLEAQAAGRGAPMSSFADMNTEL